MAIGTLARRLRDLHRHDHYPAGVREGVRDQKGVGTELGELSVAEIWRIPTVDYLPNDVGRNL